MTAGGTPEHMYALPVGTFLHEYRIEALLGFGGFGITYRATDTSLSKQVAIKEYLPSELAGRVSDRTVRAKSADDQTQFQAGVEAFLDEARLVARVRHRNIMEVIRFFQANGTGYIVLGFEKGRTLRQRLDEGPLDETELRRVLGGLLDGLEVLHDQAILHRDVKPSNVILSESRGGAEPTTPVLIDFGAARDFRSRHSRSITTIVAPGYAPPEQYGIGGQPGPWSDLYALGATAYHGIAGEAPPEALRRLRNDPYVPARERGAGRYDARLLALIDWMLAVDEPDRPQSVAAVRAVLDGTADPPGWSPAKPEVAPPAETGSGGRGRRPAAAFAVVAAVAIGVAGWSFREPLSRWWSPVATADRTTPAEGSASQTPPTPTPAAPKPDVPKPDAVADANGAKPPTPPAEPGPGETAVKPSPDAPAPSADAAKPAPAPVASQPKPEEQPVEKGGTLMDALAAGYEPVPNRVFMRILQVDYDVLVHPGGKIVAVAGGRRVALFDTVSMRPMRQMTGSNWEKTAMAFSHDGRSLAIGDRSGEIAVWDVEGGRRIASLNGKGKIVAVGFASDDRTLAAVDDEGDRRWSIPEGSEVAGTADKPKWNKGATALSPDATLVAWIGQVPAAKCCSSIETIRLVDAATGSARLEAAIDGFSDIGIRPRFTPDGKRVVFLTKKSGATDLTAIVFDVERAVEIRRFDLAGLGGTPTYTFSSQGREILAPKGSFTNSIKRWSLASGEQLPALVVESVQGFGVLDEDRLVSFGRGADIYSLSTGQRTVEADFGTKNGMFGSGDAEIAGFSMAYDGSAHRVLDLEEGTYSPDGHTESGTSFFDTGWDRAAFTPSPSPSFHVPEDPVLGRSIIATFKNDFDLDAKYQIKSRHIQLSVFDSTKYNLLKQTRIDLTSELKSRRAEEIYISRDNSKLMVVLDAGYYLTVDTKTLRVTSRTHMKGPYPNSTPEYCVSPDLGVASVERIPSKSLFAETDYWRVTRPDGKSWVTKPGLPTLGCGFSADGKTFAIIASGESAPAWRSGTVSTLALFDAATGRELRRTEASLADNGMHPLVWSPDGKTIATAELNEPGIALWDVRTGENYRHLDPGMGSIRKLVFSDDSSRIFVLADAGYAVWSIPDGVLQLRVFLGRKGNAVAFDGKGMPIEATGEDDDIYHFVKGTKVYTPSEMRAKGYVLPGQKGARP